MCSNIFIIIFGYADTLLHTEFFLFFLADQKSKERRPHWPRFIIWRLQMLLQRSVWRLRFGKSYVFPRYWEKRNQQVIVYLYWYGATHHIKTKHKYLLSLPNIIYYRNEFSNIARWIAKSEINPHTMEIIYALLDEDGDRNLSIKEFSPVLFQWRRSRGFQHQNVQISMGQLHIWAIFRDEQMDKCKYWTAWKKYDW